MVTSSCSPLCVVASAMVSSVKVAVPFRFPHVTSGRDTSW